MFRSSWFVAAVVWGTMLLETAVGDTGGLYIKNNNGGSRTLSTTAAAIAPTASGRPSSATAETSSP